MLKKNSLFLLIALGYCTFAGATSVHELPPEQVYELENGQSLHYEKPTLFGWMTRAPTNLGEFWDRSFNRDNLGNLATITASTALLIAYDEDILLASQRLARKMGLISDTRHGREVFTPYEKNAAGVNFPVYFPANLNSALYYIGDGYTQAGLVGSFVGYGLYNNDYRALSAASQNVEALFFTGIIVQVLKRSTGREAPFRRTEKGGKWQFFPNQKDYNEHTPDYDAFPSGHLATAVASTLVFSANYPEYTFIKPLGFTLSGLLAFGMLNNGVHWAGDYPLGIAIGVTSANIVTSRIKRSGDAVSQRENKPGWKVVPAMVDNAPAIALRYEN